MNDLYPPGIVPVTKPTIRMPRALWEKWDAALRSGEYQQTTGTLKDVHEDGRIGYCCLGVLQMAADGDVERYQDSGAPRALPTDIWAQAHGVQTRYVAYGYYWRDSASFVIATAADSATQSIEASLANDKYRASFEQIANLVKAAVEFTEGGRP